MHEMTYVALSDLVKNNKSLFSFPKINKDELYVKLKDDVQKAVLRSKKKALKDVKEDKITKEQAAPIIQRSEILWKAINTEWTANG